MSSTPKSISEYFEYKNTHDKTGLLSVFTNDARILDRGEGREVHGKDEIEIWIDTSLSGINLHTEVSKITEDDGLWVVETVVSGNFSASPAKFIYRITLDTEKIASLDIEFGGSLRGS